MGAGEARALVKVTLTLSSALGRHGMQALRSKQQNFKDKHRVRSGSVG